MPTTIATISTSWIPEPTRPVELSSFSGPLRHPRKNTRPPTVSSSLGLVTSAVRASSPMIPPTTSG